ncbi:hypothetical protein [Halegenticoccus tardaugens]|uniref:hypothetical protein n=1 Tax=Halegenticoccus tardaugens TaxID=2071624 RepID=UPI00100AA243|nr:hypothetical protein [Halegenticoccus tardaugens]
MRGRQWFAAAFAAMLVVAGASAFAGTAAADDAQTIDVEQEGEAGTATVSATENDTAVEGATVEVEADGNYSGAGDYETDENGTVELPAPNETTDVNVTVVVDEETETTIELAGPELAVDAESAADGTAVVSVTRYGAGVPNASVSVAADGDYSGAGDYATNDEGTVELPAPNETTDVEIEASEGNETVETTATLDARGGVDGVRSARLRIRRGTAR